MCVCVCVCVLTDGHQFMQKTLTERFNKKRIEACRLEMTKSVIVQGDTSHISEECLILYFSRPWRSGGDIIKSFVHVNQNKSIVITFEDWKGKVTFNRYVILHCLIDWLCAFCLIIVKVIVLYIFLLINVF